MAPKKGTKRAAEARGQNLSAYHGLSNQFPPIFPNHRNPPRCQIRHQVAVAEPSEAKKMKETLQKYGVEKSIYDRGPAGKTWSRWRSIKIKCVRMPSIQYIYSSFGQRGKNLR